MKKLLLGLLFVTSTITLTAQKPITLKFNLPVSGKYEMNIISNLDMKESVMGQDINIKSNNGFTYQMDILKDSSSWKSMTTTFKSLSVDMDAMGTKVNVDTDIPNQPTTEVSAPIASVFNSVKGSKFNMIINSKGEMRNITGFKEMEEKAMKASSNPGAQMALKGLDENSFKQNMQQLFGAYPDGPIKIGDTWKKTIKVNNQGMDIVSDNVYTLLSVNGNQAQVKVNSKLSSSGTTETNGVSSDVTMTGSNEGIIDYEISSGLPVKSNSTMKMNMVVKNNGIEIPLTMNLTINSTGRKM